MDIKAFFRPKQSTNLSGSKRAAVEVLDDEPVEAGSSESSSAAAAPTTAERGLKKQREEAASSISAGYLAQLELSGVHSSWHSVLGAEMSKPYFTRLQDFVSASRGKEKVYPPPAQVYSAFRTAFDKVSVVILGQDPYHGPGQGHGLCFSVQKGVETPPSLRNILKEVGEDVGLRRKPSHGYLGYWAEQGVLLLNAVLTVVDGKANSHAGKGWEEFTSAVIRALNLQRSGLVFMLWGGPAQQKGKFIDTSKHCVLTAAHPSPLSAYRGWFGCKHFSLCNAYLQKKGKEAIDWNLEPAAGAAKPAGSSPSLAVPGAAAGGAAGGAGAVAAAGESAAAEAIIAEGSAAATTTTTAVAGPTAS